MWVLKKKNSLPVQQRNPHTHKSDFEIVSATASWTQYVSCQAVSNAHQARGGNITFQCLGTMTNQKPETQTVKRDSTTIRFVYVFVSWAVLLHILT